MIRRIAPLPPGFAGILSTLHRDCFPDDPWDARAIAEISRMPGFFGALAWEGEEPAGFALALGLGRECELLSLGTVPPLRRRGIAVALLDWVCGEARYRGAHVVLLEVAEDNPAARALYAGRGFLPTGRRPNYYRHAGGSSAALVLRLALPAADPPR